MAEIVVYSVRRRMEYTLNYEGGVFKCYAESDDDAFRQLYAHLRGITDGD